MEIVAADLDVFAERITPNNFNDYLNFAWLSEKQLNFDSIKTFQVRKFL